MAIWMDLTNSMSVWKGGIVGIVRAELEIAKNMHATDASVRFVKYDGNNFIELQNQELDWLWNCNSVGDEYLHNKTNCSSVIQDKSEIETILKQYPALERAKAHSDSRMVRTYAGCMNVFSGLPACLSMLFSLLFRVVFTPIKLLCLMVGKIKRRIKDDLKKENEVKNTTERRMVNHPFTDGDTFFSCGWLYSGKEHALEWIKNDVDIKLVYLIYDIILLKDETSHFYDEQLVEDFREYVNWASVNCDLLLFGGKTAMEDTQAYQRKNNLPVPKGYAIKFGSEIVNDKVVTKLEGLGIDEPYLLAVGSLDGRKNYGTLYRAMTILYDRLKDDCPKLVIVGKGDGFKDLLYVIEKDPRTRNKIFFITPSDEELDYLYRNATVFLLASVWEGWSLTLPEAMQYSKCIIASDVKPIKEIGKDYIQYVDPYDPFEWADKIACFAYDDEKRFEIEERLKDNYVPITWRECGEQIWKIIKSVANDKVNSQEIYLDISLLWFASLYGGKVSGILRTEIMLIKYMYRHYPKLKFLVIDDSYGCIAVPSSFLSDIITGESLDYDLKKAMDKLKTIVGKNSPMNGEIGNKRKKRAVKDGLWLLLSVLPVKYQFRVIRRVLRSKENNLPSIKRNDGSSHSFDMPLKKGDILFNPGTGSGKNTYPIFISEKNRIGFKYVPIIYDFTPVLLPQVHTEETVEHYNDFLDFTYESADYILYGGETARQDGIEYQKKKKIDVIPSDALYFGSNIMNRSNRDINTSDDEIILNELGIKGKFVLSVGTLEIRKNYETLYRAYIRMLDCNEETPQMVFCGHPGWLSDDFIDYASRDNRVEGKLLFLEPTDEELDVLYRNCSFTILASLYEGWSLTLPESFWYGKFCLCCDTPALRETAGTLSEYIHPWDEKMWASRIQYYHDNPDALKQRELDIMSNWQAISWDDCAKQVLLDIGIY